MTAHDVVAVLRKLTGMKQVGHSGTLDPMATGVLPIAVGKACRLIRFLADDKIYRAEVLFGRSTDTDDIEGAVLKSSPSLPELAEISSGLEQFRGRIKQTPPLYSAIHIKGRRLYELARKGEKPEKIPQREVIVHSIDLLDYRIDEELGLPVLSLRIHCSTGTYIRSIARDLGELLGSCACLFSLKREKAGPFWIESSLTLEELKHLAIETKLQEAFLKPDELIKLPRVELEREQARRLSHGQQVQLDSVFFSFPESSIVFSGSEFYVLALEADKLLAVCSLPQFASLSDGQKQDFLKTLTEKSKDESFIVDLKPELVLADGSN